MGTLGGKTLDEYIRDDFTARLDALALAPTDATADRDAVRALDTILARIRANRRGIVVPLRPPARRFGDRAASPPPPPRRASPPRSAPRRRRPRVSPEPQDDTIERRTRDAALFAANDRFAVPQGDTYAVVRGDELGDLLRLSDTRLETSANVNDVVEIVVLPYFAELDKDNSKYERAQIVAILLAGSRATGVKGLYHILAAIAAAVDSQGDANARAAMVLALSWVLAKTTLGREAAIADAASNGRTQTVDNRATINAALKALGIGEVALEDTPNQFLLESLIPITFFAQENSYDELQKAFGNVARPLTLSDATQQAAASALTDALFGEQVFSQSAISNDFLRAPSIRRFRAIKARLRSLQSSDAPRISIGAESAAVGEKNARLALAMMDSMSVVAQMVELLKNSDTDDYPLTDDDKFVIFGIVYALWMTPLSINGDTPRSALARIGARPQKLSSSDERAYIRTAADLDIVRNDLLAWARAAERSSGATDVGLRQYATALRAVTLDKTLQATRKGEGATLIVPRTFNPASKEAIEAYVRSTYFVGKRSFDELDESRSPEPLALADRLSERHRLTTRTSSVLRRRYLSVDGAPELRVVRVIKLANVRIYVVDTWDTPWTAIGSRAFDDPTYQRLPVASRERALVDAARRATSAGALAGALAGVGEHRVVVADALAAADAARAPADVIAALEAAHTHAPVAETRADAAHLGAGDAPATRAGARIKQTARKSVMFERAVDARDDAALRRALAAGRAEPADVRAALERALATDYAYGVERLVPLAALDLTELRVARDAARDARIRDALSAEITRALRSDSPPLADDDDYDDDDDAEAKRQRTRNAAVVVTGKHDESSSSSSSSDTEDEAPTRTLFEALEADARTQALAGAVRAYNPALRAALDDAAARYTLFAPIDAAIGDDERALLAVDQVGAGVLDYHVVETRDVSLRRAAALRTRARTDDGARALLELEPLDARHVRLNGARVTIVDEVHARNGHVYLIDAVLVPPALAGDSSSSSSSSASTDDRTSFLGERAVDLGNAVADDVARFFSLAQKTSLSSSSSPPTTQASPKVVAGADARSKQARVVATPLEVDRHGTLDEYRACMERARSTVATADDGDAMFTAVDGAYTWLAANADAVRTHVAADEFAAPLAALRSELAARGYATDDSPAFAHVDALEGAYRSV